MHVFLIRHLTEKLLALHLLFVLKLINYLRLLLVTIPRKVFERVFFLVGIIRRILAAEHRGESLNQFFDSSLHR
jgi:hypothetical protein